MRDGLEQRLWLIMERGLREFDRCAQPRPELWPLIRECLSLILEYPPERIVSGAAECSLDSSHLMPWIIAEGRQLELAGKSKLAELEACWREWESDGYPCMWSAEDYTPHLHYACG